MQEEAICKREYPWECTTAIFKYSMQLTCTEAVKRL